IAKNLVAAGVAKEVLVQLAYAIGVAKPVSVFVNTYGTASKGLTDGEIAVKIQEIFDLRPAKIIERLKLKYPIYDMTAAYGQMGRDPFTTKVELVEHGITVTKEFEFCEWERLDAV